MKKVITIVFTLSLCALLPSCIWNKKADQKTAKTIEKEVDTQAALIEVKSIKEPVEIELDDAFEDDEFESDYELE